MVYYSMLGRRVRELRKARDLTQRELAERAQLSLIFIKKLEAGERGNSTVKTLTRLAKALGVPVAELLK